MIRFIVMALLCLEITQAQTSNFEKIDSLFISIEKEHKGMGNFSLFRNGQEVYQRPFGYAEVETDQKANTSTKYRIGSITKSFTATMVMQLIEEGKLRLNNYVAEYFPQIPNASKMTIEDLLRHESGLFNITEDPEIGTWITQPQSRQQMLDRIVTNGVTFQPKAKTSYSNTNFILLSYIIEDLEQKDYATLLKDRIVRPLQLKRTELGKPINSGNNEALAYFRKDDAWHLIEDQTDMSAPMGAGGITSSPSELNRFFIGLFSEKLISKTSLEQMKDHKDGVGMGLMKPPFGEMEVYGHGGSIDGFQSFAAYFPNEGIAVAIVSNGFEGPLTSSLITAVQLYFGM
ncbi:MAG: serine hydrolase domain-containing protein [Bacteroidota bacterium]